MENDIRHNDLDELRRTWRSQTFKAPETESREPRHVRRAGAYSEQLASRYGFFAAICAVWTVLVWPLNHTMHLPLWLIIWMSAFFLVMGVCHWLYRDRIMKINFGRMPLTEALRSVIALRKSDNIRITFGLSMAVPMLIAMFMVFLGESRAMFEGGVLGLVIGGIVGYRLFRRNRWVIRQMQETLEDAID